MSNLLGPAATFSYGACVTRIVDPQPRGFRWLERADGTKVLQYACAWSQGCEGGFEWVDVPTVFVGEATSVSRADIPQHFEQDWKP